MNDKDLLEDHKTIDYIKKTNDLIAVHRKSHLEQALDVSVNLKMFRAYTRLRNK